MSFTSVVFVSFLLVSAQAFGNAEVERLLDSYIVAKAEVFKPTLDEEQIKHAPYTIQVASYINEKDAASHVEELKLQEPDVIYFPAFVRGQVWFKVCVGKFKEKGEAEAYRQKFTKRMDEPFAIVISLLDRPKADDKNKEPSPKKESKPKAEVAKASKPSKSLEAPKVLEVSKSDEAPDLLKAALAKERKPASLGKKESVKVPVAKSDDKSGGSSMNVKLISKNEPIEAKPLKVKPTSVKLVATKDANKNQYYYSLQVGAFPTEKLVKENLAQLPIKDKTAYYKSAVVKGKTWYRLFVGRFETRREAEHFQKHFSEQVRGGESFIRRVTASESTL